MPRALQRLLMEFNELFLRRGLCRYDSFGASKGLLTLAYLRQGRYKKDWVSAYEHALAEYSGAPHAISFASGRLALCAILEAMGIGEGDEVILPAFTCVAVANAVVAQGAKPVYVDIGKGTFNIDVAKIEKAISPRTRAVLAQHTFGQPCDIEAVLDIARQRDVMVIEDCAHAFGASLRGRKLGTFADAAFGSTDFTKVFSTSSGGFALCASRQLADKIRLVQKKSLDLPWHIKFRIFVQYALMSVLLQPSVYWASKIFIALLGKMKLWFYCYDDVKTDRSGLYSSKLSNFQAFIGWNEVQTLASNIRHRRGVAARYQMILMDESSGLADGAYLCYSVLVVTPGKWKKALGKHFKVGHWFSSFAQGRKDDRESIQYVPGSCPVAEYTSAHVINFPTHALIGASAMERFRALMAESGLKQDIVATSEIDGFPLAEGRP